MCASASCMCAKEHASRVAVRVLSTELTFIASLGREGGVRHAHGHSRVLSARAERGVRARQHRRQDGQRAADGARAARLGEDLGPPSEATLGPTFLTATPRCARRRCQARHHIPKGSRYPQQTHPGEVSKAER